MSYFWEDTDGAGFAINHDLARPTISWDEMEDFTGVPEVYLPTDPVDVEALLRAILQDTGCELSYSTSRTDFAPSGRPGGVRVIKLMEVESAKGREETAYAAFQADPAEVDPSDYLEAKAYREALEEM